ncbi:MAG: glycosyltransferase [Phycisphaerae bacterium]
MTTAAQPLRTNTLESLEALRAGGDHYGFLNAALRYLRKQGDDERTAWLVCQSYVALGLIGPARDVSGRLSADQRCAPELQQLREQVSKLPSGRLGFGSLQSRFDANVARLYAAHPALRAHDATFRGIPRRYELYASCDGNVHAARRSGDGEREWVPDLCPVRQLVDRAALPHDAKALFCDPYLVVGDRLGLMFGRVFDATRTMFLTFTPRIYVVESDVDAFGLTLFTTKAIERFCDKRVSLFVGEDCVEQIAGFFREGPGLTMPGYAMRLTAEGKRLGQAVHAALQPHVAAAQRSAQRELELGRRHYDSLSVDHWVDRFRPDRNKPLRVLGITSRFTTYLQYSMRDWAAAFESRGHEFVLLIEASDHDLLPQAKILETIREFKPDLIAVIDHHRKEYGAVIPSHVPFVCWIQDMLPGLANAEAGRSLGPLDFFIANEPTMYVQGHAYPASQGLAWTMATDERTYSQQALAEEELKSYRCDLSYVSSHSTPPEKFHDERRAWFAKEAVAVKLLECLFEAVSGSFAENPRTAFGGLYHLFGRVKARTGLRPSSEVDAAIVNSYLFPLAELIFRQSTLEWVADYCDRTDRKLCLYGNGWEEHPRFGRYACGFAENGAELRAIYQASAVNLQIIGTGAVHQRLLDGLASGGFFLIRYATADVMHDAIRRYLAAYRMYRPEVGVEFAREDAPDLIAAMEELSAIRGLHERFERATVDPEELARYEEFEAMGFKRQAGAVFAEYGDIAFASADEFAELADRYLGDRASRQQISASMREAVIERYSYGALVDDLLGFIHQRLSAQA